MALMHGTEFSKTEEAQAMSVKAVTRRGNPVWRVQVIRDGGKFNRRRFLDRRSYLKRDAIEAETELIAEYEASKAGAGGTTSENNPAPGRTPKSIIELQPTPAWELGALGEVPLFAAFAEQYLVVQDHSRPDFKNKERTVRLHLLPFFGETPLSEISRQMIDMFKVKLRTPTGERATSRRTRNATQPRITSRRKGGPKSPKTINNLLTTLRSILNLAYDYELVDRVPRIKMEPIKKRDADFLDDDEVAAFLGAAPPQWRVFLLTAIRTGLRRGELFELRWGDLHLDARRPFLRVSRALHKDAGVWRVKEPKGGKPRSVPLSKELLRALQELHSGQGPNDLVFADENGEYLHRDGLWRLVVNTAREARIDKHVHPHLLRHTFASHCYQRGIPPQVVQQWLGHANIATTERYAHLTPDTGEELIDLLDAPKSATEHVSPTRQEDRGLQKGGGEADQWANSPSMAETEVR